MVSKVLLACFTAILLSAAFVPSRAQNVGQTNPAISSSSTPATSSAPGVLAANKPPKELSIGDIAQLVGLPITILIAWATISHGQKQQLRLIAETGKQQRELLLLSDSIQTLSSLVSISEQVSSLVLNNLLTPGPDWRKVPKQATALRKQLEVQAKMLKLFLTDHQGMALDLAYGEWYDATFCDLWPRTNKSKKISEGDTRIQDLQNQQVEFSMHISSLKLNLINTQSPLQK